jgi:hypothetical protein
MIDHKLVPLLSQEALSSCKIEESQLMMEEAWANGSMKKIKMEKELESLPLTTSTLTIKIPKKCKKVFKPSKINL